VHVTANSKSATRRVTASRVHCEFNRLLSPGAVLTSTLGARVSEGRGAVNGKHCVDLRPVFKCAVFDIKPTYHCEGLAVTYRMVKTATRFDVPFQRNWGKGRDRFTTRPNSAVVAASPTRCPSSGTDA